MLSDAWKIETAEITAFEKGDLISKVKVVIVKRQWKDHVAKVCQTATTTTAKKSADSSARIMGEFQDQ